MYESFYGLKAKPFELHPDPDFLYLSPTHDDVYTHLRYAVREGKGFAVITGEIGAGKTTLLHYLRRKMPASREVVTLTNTSVPPDEFLWLFCRGLHLEPTGGGKAGLLHALQQHLLALQASGRRVVLIVDEAQNLPEATIEEVRMLSNLDAEKGHPLQIILVGQPELRDKLRRPELAQFLQRVTVHCHLKRLNRNHVERYVRHRLRAAGARDLGLFDQEALDAVTLYSGGTPRLINTLCDTALVFGFGEGQRVIDRKAVEEVWESRAEGGLLAPAEGAEKAAEPTPPVAPEQAEQAEAEDRIRSLEKRLRNLEEFADAVGPAIELLKLSGRQGFEMIKALRRDLEAQVGAPLPSPRAEGGRPAPGNLPGSGLRKVLGGKDRGS